MHTGNIAKTNPENGIFSTFGYAVTLTFDLSTLDPVPNYIIVRLHLPRVATLS